MQAKKIILAVMTALMLSSCSGVFMSDNIQSSTSKNQMPSTVTADVDDLAYGEYHVMFGSLRGVNIIHDQQNELLIKSYETGNNDTHILYRGHYQNPLKIRIDKNFSGHRRDIQYVQFDNSQRMWILDGNQQPIPCTPYKACSLNIFKGTQN